jgi:hypothetical protein
VFVWEKTLASSFVPFFLDLRRNNETQLTATVNCVSLLCDKRTAGRIYLSMVLLGNSVFIVSQFTYLISEKKQSSYSVQRPFDLMLCFSIENNLCVVDIDNSFDAIEFDMHFCQCR